MNNRELDLQAELSSVFENIYVTESIIKLTLESCLEKELRSNHYNLSPDKSINLSEERNHYINLLNIALDKLSIIKELNNRLEDLLIGLE